MAKKTRNQARLKRKMRVRRRISGTPDRPRLSVFRSLSEIYAQVIDDESGSTLASASTIEGSIRTELKGKNKMEQAAIVGDVVAKRAQEKGIETVVFDRSGFRYMGRVKALAESARKGGLEF